MKAEELRIGNILTDDLGNLLTVTEIKHNKLRCSYLRKDTGNIHYSFIDLCNIKPIRLSEDILLKCGFVDNRLSIFNDLNYMSLIWRHSKLWLTSEHEPSCLEHIKNVHELQNLVKSLTGQELEINL